MSSNLSFFIFALIIMATKRIIPDPDFGYIILRSRRLARNITMRVKPDGLYVTVPPYSKTDRVMAVLSSYRERLLEDFRKVAVKKIDFNFSIQSECFRLSLVPSDMKCFMLRQTEEGINICCPRDTDFSKEEVQKLVRNAIIRALKKAAASYLPPLLRFWSERYGLPYKKVRITGARTRWGSCTATRTISLSCYLMLVPSKLMDYVILHELAHTREMNHGEAFWTLLDSMTEGQSLRLRAELRKFCFPF